MSRRSEILKTLKENITHYEWQTLKEKYKLDVNSNRRWEEISDVGELLEVLEDRQVLKRDSVDVLQDIVQNIAGLQGRQIKIEDFFDERDKPPVLPQEVVKLISTRHAEIWRELAGNLLIGQHLVENCSNIQDVLSHFETECEQISKMEMNFRLLRAMGKCNVNNLELETLLTH